MALDALEHRDVAEIDRMFEGFVGLVTRLAFAIGKAAEVHRMLERDRLRRRCRTLGVRQYSVADVAIVANHLPAVTHVFAVVTTKTT